MFDIVDSAQFYRMVVADYDEFIAEQHSARRALHCAISTYHLYEWIWADWLKPNKVLQSRLGIRDRDEFLRWIMKHCIWFVWTKDLANGTKHCIRRLDFGAHLVAPPPLNLDNTKPGQAAAPRPILLGAQGNGYLIIDNGPSVDSDEEMSLDEEDDDGFLAAHDPHRFLPVAHLLEVSVRFWRDFFRLYRPECAVEHSVHHAF